MSASTALVTGASSGIGKEIARLLVRRGLTVWVGSRDAGRSAAAAAEIGGDARPLRLDVTDAADVAAAAARIDRLDVLVNNAGVSPREARPAQEEDVADVRRVYEVNVFGPVAVTNALLPVLRRSACPRIVNVSSGTGSLGWAEGAMADFGGAFASYRSSKAALNALTLFYAQSLAGDGVKVNALAPGIRRTGLNEAAARRGGDPAEAAEAAVALALLPADGPTGTFTNWDGTRVPW